MDRKILEAPVFFPSASRVKIPFVGDDTRQVKLLKSNLNPIPNPLEKHQKLVGSFMIKDVSNGIAFGKDVVRERCAHTLPYDEKEMLKAYDCSDFVSQVSFQQKGGRFDTRGYIQKIPCQFKKLVSPRAARMPQPIRTVAERHGDISAPPSTAGSACSTESSFEKKLMTEVKPHSAKFRASQPLMYTGPLTSDKLLAQRQANRWDEFVLGKLSKDTARWIVFENLDPGAQKDRLDNLVRQKFGSKISNTNLVREDAKDSDFKAIEQRKEEKHKRKLDEKKLAKKLENISQMQNDPILQQTFAQYYKLPRYLKQERQKCTKVVNDVNQTAQNLQVRHLEPPPPPKMEDFLNPNAGGYFYATDNAFEQQLYTNQAKPVFQIAGDKTRIIMDDLSEYQSNLQSMYPPLHSQWSHGQSLKKARSHVRPGKYVKGLQRWTGLPTPADFASELGLNVPTIDDSEIEHVSPPQTNPMLDNAPMIHIIDEWRSKWKLAGRWQEVTLADVLLDLDNIHGHIRLGAVAACAMAALHKMPVEDMAVMSVLPKVNAALVANKTNVGHLFEGLLEKVHRRLHDSHKRVQLAAAMCLYTMNECNDEIMEILQHNLEHGMSTDCMACAQCLALKGSTDARVVHLIIQMLLETEEEEQATALLVHLSQHTRLVHSLLAEQLNSSCWKDKVIACNVLSKLSGNINRDLVHKLSNLMWGDWSSEVRKAASRTLGKTGHGRDVHFELREKLTRGNERVCVDVLRKIAHLGIMTATLLPEFLNCFSAEHVSVRLESVRAAAKLRICDDKVIAELLRLTEFDPAWKIKAYAIKAIGEIGIVSDKIQGALVWALRFEDKPGVRMEACVALRKLDCKANEVILVLQDRVLVEPDPTVKEEVRRTLDAFGMSGPEDNMEMIRQIKNEVKKLCRKSVVAAKVVLYERELQKFERKAQYIGRMLEDLSSDEESDAEVDMEITRALKQSRATSRGKTGSSEPRKPSIVVTPCRDQVSRISEVEKKIPAQSPLVNNNMPSTETPQESDTSAGGPS